VHARHDDIGDEQVDVTWVAACDVEGFWAIRGGDHLIAVPGEDPLGYLSEGILVLDYQDGLSVGCPLAGYGFCYRGDCLRGDRQHDAESRACAGFGVDLDVALGLADDPVHGGQPEPGTGAFFFGGEEWLEYVLNYVRGHAAASVTDP
jgi:hypothetical protein